MLIYFGEKLITRITMKQFSGGELKYIELMIDDFLLNAICKF